MPRLKIGARYYDAEERTVTGTVNVFFVVRVGPGGRNRLWIHKDKSVTPFNVGLNAHELHHAEDQLANNYLTASIQLYRGLSITSPGASDARSGISRPKPSATLEEPDFTSDTSTTKFVPFSTNRPVSMSFAKSSFRSGNPDKLEWLLADEPYGILLTIRVNTLNSLCIFDIGEVQVLNPPRATVELLTPAGAHNPVNIADAELSVPLNAAAPDFAALGRLLGNTAWDAEGVAFIGTKTPDGIQKMRQAFNQGHYWDIFRIAKKKSDEGDSRRSQKVIDLYEGLKEMLTYIRETDQDQLTLFRDELRQFSQFMQQRLS
ncbi:MAG TPA: hypothetical protein VJA19_02820 [Pseudomonas sp.]|nr:hypothetical protein [Pseudomonas sp.]